MKKKLRRQKTSNRPGAKMPPKRKTPYEIYAALDLGPGDYAIAPASKSREAVRAAIMRKHKRRESDQ